MTAVVDASVVAAALVEDGSRGDRARRALGQAPLAVPAHLHVEVDLRLARAPGPRCVVRTQG